MNTKPSHLLLWSFFCLSLCFSTSLKASHQLGAAFNTKIIRDTSQTNPFRMDIGLLLVYTDGGLSFWGTTTIKIMDPRGVTHTLSISKDSSHTILGYKDCFVDQGGIIRQAKVGFYSGTFNIDTAGTYTISAGVCCGAPVYNIINYGGASVGGYIRVQVPDFFLNGHGSNQIESTPIREEHLYAEICAAAGPYAFPFFPNSRIDSLWVERDNVKSIPFAGGPYFSPLPFLSGHTFSNPLGALGQSLLDNSTGVDLVSVNSWHHMLMAYSVKQYSIDPQNPSTKYLASEMYFHRNVIGDMNCAKDTSSNNLNLSGVLNAPLQVDSCSYNVGIPLPKVIDRSTIAADGSDFEILDQTGNSIPILSAFLDRDLLRVEFSNLVTSGQYKLIPKIGTDSNTIGTKCLDFLLANDTLSFTVAPCRNSSIASAAFNCRIVRDSAESSAPEMRIAFLTILDDATGSLPTTTGVYLKDPKGVNHFISLSLDSNSIVNGYTDCYVGQSSSRNTARVGYFSGSFSVDTAGTYLLSSAQCCGVPVHNVSNYSQSAVSTSLKMHVPDSYLAGLGPDVLHSSPMSAEHLYAEICASAGSYAFPALAKPASDSLEVRREHIRHIQGTDADNYTYALPYWGYGLGSPLGGYGQAQLDSENGIDLVSVNTYGHLALSYVVDQYKPDPLNPGSSYLFSEMYFVRQVMGDKNCSKDSSTYSSSRLSSLLPANLQTDSCAPVLGLPLPNFINRATIAADGSDFSIIDSAGNPVAVLSAYMDVNTLKIEFPSGTKSGSYRLINTIGSDSNTIGTNCFNFLLAPDTIPFEIVCIISGIGSEEYPLADFSLFPNPLSGSELQFDFPTVAQLYLYDINGRLIFQSAKEVGHGSLQLPQLQAGLYLAKIQYGDQVKTVKLLITQP